MKLHEDWMMQDLNALKADRQNKAIELCFSKHISFSRQQLTTVKRADYRLTDRRNVDQTASDSIVWFSCEYLCEFQ